MKIAVLIATYNRKNKTLTCLESLYAQKLDNITLEVYQTDDASSDGTPEAVKQQFPEVKLLHGSGSLFWAGGMRHTWKAALSSNADYYLLLNDDTLLAPNALSELLHYNWQVANQLPAICIGTTKDAITGRISYGGHRLFHARKAKYYSVYSESEYMECDMANANIMLVPNEVVAQIGILSTAYTHSIADFDYTLKAKRAGFKVIVVPGILGYCTDDHGRNWKSNTTSLKERIKYLKSPKGLAYHEYLHFIRKYFPLNLPAAFFKLWLKTIFPILWDKLKR